MSSSGEDVSLISKRRSTKTRNRRGLASSSNIGASNSNPPKSGNELCRLCHSQASDLDLDLQLLETPDNKLRAHYFCLLFSSGLHQNGNEDEGLRGFLEEDVRQEIKRGNRLKCVYCKQKGATVGCAKTQCKKSYHLPCGMRNKSLQQHFDQFKSFCCSHRPAQKIPARYEKRRQASNVSEDTCPICRQNVEPKATFSLLFTPCCQGWIHRTCLQKSVGSYHLRCPLCNDSKVFYQEMLRFGLHIPEQDATWERGNDYDLTLKPALTCSAKMCICENPDGRKYNEIDGLWEILPCDGCGSRGIHVRCGGLEAYVEPLWYCYTCRRVVKYEETKKKMLRSINEVWGSASATRSGIHKSVSAQREEIFETFRLQVMVEEGRPAAENFLQSPNSHNDHSTTFKSRVQISPKPTMDHMNLFLEDIIINGLNKGCKPLPSTSIMSAGTRMNLDNKKNCRKRSEETDGSPGDSDYESAQEVGVPFKIRKKSVNSNSPKQSSATGDESESVVPEIQQTLDQQIEKTIKNFFHKAEAAAT